MKAINYILGFGAFAAAVVAAIFCAKLGAYALSCGDLKLAAVSWFGIIWFGAAAIKLAAWACR